MLFQKSTFTILKDSIISLLVLYFIAHHKDALVKETKDKAESNDEEFDWITTE